MNIIDNKLIKQFGKIEIESPTDIIFKQIRSLITNNLLKPGEKLPSERDLAEKFNVSRVIIREGLKLLEFNGLIKKIPPHKGLFVSKSVYDSFSIFIDNIILNKDNFKDFFRIWCLTQIEAILFFPDNYSSTLEILKEINSDLKKNLEDFKRFFELEKEFHLVILKKCENNILKSVSIPFNNKIFKISENNLQQRKNLEKVIIDHDEIINNVILKNFNQLDKILKNHF